MIYEFECFCKGSTPITKVINVPMSEYYKPTCPNCEKPMNRVYHANIIAGALNPENIPKK